MRWLVGILLILGLGAIGSYIFIKGYPYRLYSNWVEGTEWNRYYSISNYRSLLLGPTEVDEVPPYKEDYSQLWKDFPIRNAKIPLPVRHPMFQTIPILESNGKKAPPEVGVGILNPQGRELSRIYTFPMMYLPDLSQGQDLFKLPFVRNRILKFPKDKLWKDLFSKEIIVESKSMDEMIYDLYLLYFRSKILPKKAIGYGVLDDERVVIVLDSEDKDYKKELIMRNDNGSIYSFVLRTEINKEESMKLRAKFLHQVSFVPNDPALAKFLYTEFKHLNFSRQVDQEGMLYLYSAWTQDMENLDLLKEAIFFLERGRDTTLQLRPLYFFALKHYGKTFTTRRLFNDHDDPGLVLQRKIEIENIERAQAAERAKAQLPEPKELTPDERMDFYLRQAKEAPTRDKSDMTVH